jgi:hypothetical protein
MVPPKPDPIRPADCTHPHPLFSENFIQGFFKGFALALAIIVPFIILWTFFFTALTVHSIKGDIRRLEESIKVEKQK